MIEDDKRIACRWLELVSEHDIEQMLTMTAPTWAMHGGPPGPARGHAGPRELFEHIGPIEQEWTVHDVIAEGDKVVVGATNSVLQESFLGVPGRGVRQVFTAMFIHRIVDGLVVETWRNADDLGRLVQLGARIEPGG